MNTMAKQQFGRSRRAFVVAAIAGIPAALLPRTAAASDKMTKPQAEYQDTANGIYSCELCTLFVAPDGCKVVEGAISKGGWCKAFAAVD
ncbi:iron oxidase [Bradyrhizobium sp. B124]|uniref:iron oxidase n=1 Tax=Bradyrhizobium sp. B124 TaxID=3140245 RepID=UPI0031844E6A